MNLLCSLILSGAPGRWLDRATGSWQKLLVIPLGVALLVLPGSQALRAATTASSEPSLVNQMENEGYYYDALGVAPPVREVALPTGTAGQPAGPTPFGVASPVQLTSSGIPAPAYRAYLAAAAELARTDPDCGLHWSVVAGIGRVESNHGRFGGSTVTAAGTVTPPILGPRLDGSNSGWATIRDSDDGRYDGDTAFDRAVGPMQFLPGTWSIYGAGKNPQNMNDAALATARYLCAGDLDLRTQQGRWAAVYRYNHSDSYVSLVLSLADSYASGHVVTFPARPANTPTDDGDESATPGGTPPSVPVVKPKPTPTTTTSAPSATTTTKPTTVPTTTKPWTTTPSTTTAPPTSTTQAPEPTTPSTSPTEAPTPTTSTTTIAESPTSEPTGTP